jgi:multiple sugar transport system permease protein
VIEHVREGTGEGIARPLPVVPAQRRSRAWRRQLPYAVALAPAAALLGFFYVWPALWAIYTSLTDLSLTLTGGAEARFVGLENYRRLFRHADFRLVVENSIVFVAGSALVGQIGLGLGLALLLEQARRRGYRLLAGLTQAAVLTAWICPLALAAFVWVEILDYYTGSLNAALVRLDREPVDWLGRFPMASVIVADVWRGTGFALLIFLGALRTVPPEIHEAARVDGAGAWRRFRDQTLPLILPFGALALLATTITTLGNFLLIEVLTKGAGLQTMTLALFAYRNAFESYQIGYGAAVAVVILAINLVLALALLPIWRSRR